MRKQLRKRSIGNIKLQDKTSKDAYKLWMKLERKYELLKIRRRSTSRILYCIGGEDKLGPKRSQDGIRESDSSSPFKVVGKTGE